MPTEQRPLKVFLCHASADKPKVRELYRYLKRRGIKPWFDETDLVGGQDWQVEIPKALATSDAIVICLTKNSVDKEGYIQKEIKFALDKALEMPEGRIFLIPVRFEECKVPYSLSRYQWVDLFDEAGYARMMRALKTRAAQLDRDTVNLHQSNEAEKASREKVEITGQLPKEKSPSLLNRLLDPKYIGLLVAVIVLLFGNNIYQQFTGRSVFAGAPTPTHTFPAQTFTPALQVTPELTDSSTSLPSATLTEPAATLPSNSSRDVLIAQSFQAPGQSAQGITWDGTSLWVSDNSSQIFKLDPAGQVLDSVLSPEYTPQGLTWDGSSFWVFTTNYLFIYRFQIAGSNAQMLTSFRSPAEVTGGDITQDMAWDGENLWYANQFKVYKLDISGKVLHSLTFPQNVAGLDWDGSDLWIAYNDFPDNAVLSKVNPEGEILETYISPIFQIKALAWADEYLWALGLDVLGGDVMTYKLQVEK